MMVWGCATAKPLLPSLLLGGSESSGFDGRRALFAPYHILVWPDDGFTLQGVCTLLPGQCVMCPVGT